MCERGSGGADNDVLIMSGIYEERRREERRRGEMRRGMERRRKRTNVCVFLCVCQGERSRDTHRVKWQFEFSVRGSEERAGSSERKHEAHRDNTPAQRNTQHRVCAQAAGRSSSFLLYFGFKCRGLTVCVCVHACV